jgi:hypothetical protein
VALIHVTQSSAINISDFGAHWVGDTQALHIQAIELKFIDGERTLLPSESNALKYYANQVIIQCGSERGSINDLICSHLEGLLGSAKDECKDYEISCPPGTLVVGPRDGDVPLKPLACVHLRAAMTRAKTISGPVVFDPYLLVPDIMVRNLASGEERTFSQHGLRLGINNVFDEGKFYEQPQLATYYYCDHIQGGIATLFLIESFQHGHLIQAELRVHTKYADLYVPVTDATVIQRLERRLGQLQARQRKG